MSMEVEKQSETIDVIHNNTTNIQEDTEAGYVPSKYTIVAVNVLYDRYIHTVEAVKSAAGARRKRWICFGITVVVILVLLIVLLIKYHPWTK